jgi:hypothetical protein
VGCFSGGVILDAGLLCCPWKPAQSPFVIFAVFVTNGQPNRIPASPAETTISPTIFHGRLPLSVSTCPFPSLAPHEIHPAPPRLPPCPFRSNARLQGKRSSSGAVGRFVLAARSKTGARLVPKGFRQCPPPPRTESIDKANKPPTAKSKPRFLCVNAELQEIRTPLSFSTLRPQKGLVATFMS